MAPRQPAAPLQVGGALQVGGILQPLLPPCPPAQGPDQSVECCSSDWCLGWGTEWRKWLHATEPGDVFYTKKKTSQVCIVQQSTQSGSILCFERHMVLC